MEEDQRQDQERNNIIEEEISKPWYHTLEEHKLQEVITKQHTHEKLT